MNARLTAAAGSTRLGLAFVGFYECGFVRGLFKSLNPQTNCMLGGVEWHMRCLPALNTY
jgi:hypothetical protein